MNKLLVENISPKATRDELAGFFSRFGSVKYCCVIDQEVSSRGGIGYVSFTTATSTELALKASGEQLEMNGRVLQISRAVAGKMIPGVHVCDPCACVDDVTGSHDSRKGSHDSRKGSHDYAKAADLTALRGDKMSHDLTDDALVHIFSYLDLRGRITIERVCRRWCKLARVSWLTMKRLSFQGIFAPLRGGERTGLTDDILHSVLRRVRGSVESIDLSKCPCLLTEDALCLIGHYCPSLVHFEVPRGMPVSEASFKRFCQSCCGLKWLQMKRCLHVEEKSLWWALHLLPELAYLCVTNNHKISGQCLYQAGGNLRTVILNDCTELADGGVAFVAERCPDLEVLGICRCPKLTGKIVEAICEHSFHLKELNFCGPNQMVKTSELLQMSSLTKLEVLRLDQQLSCTDDVMAVWARNMPNLRVLSLQSSYHISDKGLACLVACQHLCDIDLSYCNQITDAGLSHIGGQGCLKRLATRACQKLSDKVFCFIAEMCVGLEDLDICGCRGVTDKTVYALQESLLYMRGARRAQFVFAVGGTSISSDVARRFAVATGSSVTLHDLSVPYLRANYDPFLTVECITELAEESWDDDNCPSFAPVMSGHQPSGGFH